MKAVLLLAKLDLDKSLVTVSRHISMTVSLHMKRPCWKWPTPQGFFSNGKKLDTKSSAWQWKTRINIFTCSHPTHSEYRVSSFRPGVNTCYFKEIITTYNFMYQIPCFFNDLLCLCPKGLTHHEPALVEFGSCEGLVLIGNKSLPKPILDKQLPELTLTKIYNAIWHHQAIKS